MMFKGYEVAQDDLEEAKIGRRYFAVMESTVQADAQAQVGRRVVRLQRLPPRGEKGAVIIHGRIGHLGKGVRVERWGLGVVEVTDHLGKWLAPADERAEAQAVADGLAAELELANLISRGERVH